MTVFNVIDRLSAVSSYCNLILKNASPEALAELTGRKSGLSLGAMVETARAICQETAAELEKQYHGAGASTFTK